MCPLGHKDFPNQHISKEVYEPVRWATILTAETYELSSLAIIATTTASGTLAFHLAL